MKIHNEIDQAIGKTYSSLKKAILVIEREKDSPQEDDEVFENAEGFLSNLLETSELSTEILKDEHVRLAVELIREHTS